MRVLLTGGTGFVGLALTEALLRQGDSVASVAADLPRPWMRAALPVGDVTFHALDIRDRAGLDTLMAKGADLVIHAAAATPDAAREAAGDAASIVAVNVGGTADVIEAAAQAGIARVMALSSVAVYGRTLDDADMLTEDMPHMPQTLYAITKSAAERLALRLGAVHGVEVLCPRLGVLWGPWEHRATHRTTPSPVFHMVELARSGQDITLPFTATAPLCAIGPAIEMLLALIASNWKGGGPVNVGSDRSYDLDDVATVVARHFHVGSHTNGPSANVPFFAVNRPPMDLARLAALTGRTFSPGDLRTDIHRYAAWLDGLGTSEAPCR